MKRLHTVVIGRFQPFHLGHKRLIEEALKLGKKTCIVLGSARTAPNLKNPFTPQMRESMIRSCFDDATNARLEFVSVRDYTYNLSMWLTDVRNKVLTALDCTDYDVTLCGHFKDESSFYLKMFPNWVFEEITQSVHVMDATTIREKWLDPQIGEDSWKGMLSPSVFDILKEYRTNSTKFKDLQEEFLFNRQYKEDHKFRKDVPYSPTSVTVDAVVIQSGHILVIRRKFNPGKGLLALPGGFLQEGRTLEESVLNELKEETGIMVPAPILRAAMGESRPFDAPSRSSRGRTVTQAYLFKLPDDLEKGLPRVKGGDDAAKAFWMPLADLELKEDEFFEDHAHIIRYFNNRI